VQIDILTDSADKNGQDTYPYLQIETDKMRIRICR